MPPGVFWWLVGAMLDTLSPESTEAPDEVVRRKMRENMKRGV